MEATPLRRPRGSEIPAAPLVRLINDWVESFGNQYADRKDSEARTTWTPLSTLAERVWPDQDSLMTIRILYRILNESEYVGFDLADRIIVLGFGRPELWITDPDLAEAYEKVDLSSVDVVRPTGPKVEAALARRAVKILDEKGKGAACRQFGINLTTLNRRIDRWRELAA